PSRTYDPSSINESSGKTGIVVSALVTGFLVTCIFVGSVMAVTLRYSADQFFHGTMSQFYLYPGEVDDHVFSFMNIPDNNFLMITPTLWTLLMLAIPLASMLLIGILGHFAKSRGGSNELFALIAGLTVSVATWYLLPGMDYMINIAVTPANLGGSEFYRLRPIIMIPGSEQYLARLAAQFIVNLPIYVCTALFILYFFDYRKKWKEQTGEVSGPLLNVQRQDIIDAAKLFALGLVCSVVGVWLLTVFLDPAIVGLTIDSVFTEIAAPNGLEAVLEHYVLTQTDSRFLIIAEHNLIRTLLMLIIGPIFWASILWLVAAKRKDSVDNRLGWFSSMTLLVVAVGTGFWTLLDMERGYFDPDAWPWGLAANMALRALLVFGIFLMLILVVIGIRKATGRDMGIWWLPLFVTLFCLEYFVYDDQFTVIALVVLPLILTVLYRVALRGRPQVKAEDPLVTYIKMSLMSLAIAEVLSTALILGGLSIINFMYGGNVLFFLAHILPHAVVEIPAFLFAAAISFRIARDMWPSLEAEDWDSIPSKTRNLLSDERIWRTYALIVFFLLIAALIESFVTPLVVMMIGG
ncbi:MAG: stage II sporulation protein M, partial [Candidatus Thorarchaeota archaeon]|nr:stage II sporulation protein M [Candidatus Thorarchaeota archaeon]